MIRVLSPHVISPGETRETWEADSMTKGKASDEEEKKNKGGWLTD